MKKMCVLILVELLVFGTASYGAVSEDMSVYVRKDVFDAKMEGMNAKLDMILEEMKAQRKDINDLTKTVSGLSERVTGLSARVDGLDKRMDSLDKRIDDLRNGIYLWLVAIGLLIAWPKLYEKFQNWGKSKPSITLEDVMRLIEENNLKMERKMQA